MNPNAYRDYQFVKGGDFDTTATIIEAVRDWQHWQRIANGSKGESWQAACNVLDEIEEKLLTLRLPPVEEARRD